MAKSPPKAARENRQENRTAAKSAERTDGIQECELRIRSVVNSQMLWQRLTVDDRIRLGGNLKTAFIRDPHPADFG